MIQMLQIGVLRGSFLLFVSQPITTTEVISSFSMDICMCPSEMGEGQGTNSVEPLETDKTSQSIHNVSTVKFSEPL